MSSVSIQRNWGLTGDLFVVVGAGGGTQPPQAEGFTPRVASVDTREIYVSTSGLDTNDGLTELTPKKTIAAAEGLMRAGFPDHVLLKRGDWFRGEIFAENKAGRSVEEPAVLSDYGTGTVRPKLEFFVWNANRPPRSYTNIMGLEFYRVEMDPDSIYYNPLVEDAQTAVNDFQEYTLFEDCKFTFVQLELKTLNMTIRRCILHGAYGINTSYDKNRKPSNCHLGAYNSGYLVMEENIFDHGGWNSTVVGAAANQFDHNIYLSHTTLCSQMIFRRNISSRASSHGIQMRFGGIADNNYYARCAVSLLFGSNQNDGGNFPLNITSINNVIQDPQNMTKGTPYNTDDANNVCWGMDIEVYGLIPPTIRVEQNILGLLDLSLNPTAPDGAGLNIHSFNIVALENSPNFDPSSVDLSTNVVYHWDDQTQGDGLGLTDPDRSYKTYLNNVLLPLGYTPTGLQGTDDMAKIAELWCGRGRLEWPEELTANALNNYVRVGYDVAGDAIA